MNYFKVKFINLYISMTKQEGRHPLKRRFIFSTGFITENI